MKGSRIFLTALCFSAHTACAAGSAAQANATTAPPPDKALQITPYLWAAGLKGHISPFRHAPTIRIRQSFSDVLDELNIAAFVNVWGRYNRWVLSGDIMYVDTGSVKGVGPLPAMQFPGLGVPIPAGASVDARIRTRQFMASLQGGYRILDIPGFTLDALGGVRVWRISNKATVTADIPALGSVSASHGEHFSWADPLLGARAFLQLTDKLSILTQADIGGFGAGSDLTWSALVTANYAFTPHLSASAGYKVLRVDYSRSGHTYDTRLSGPVLGITYRF